jgi:hypothetical protein
MPAPGRVLCSLSPTALASGFDGRGMAGLGLHLPDHRQVEIFPAAVDEFFHVAFQGGEFAVAYEVVFGRDGEGRVAYLEVAAAPPGPGPSRYWRGWGRRWGGWRCAGADSRGV